MLTASIYHTPGNHPVAQSLLNRTRRVFKLLLCEPTHTTAMEKPAWLHCPDRVWQRNSALLMSQYEMAHEE